MKKIITARILLLISIGLAQAQPRGEKNNLRGNTPLLIHYNVTITNATAINTPFVEFSPMFYKRGIVFVSSQHKHGPLDEKIGERYYDIYYADLDPNGLPLKPTGFSLEINSPYHEGPVTFNRQEDRIYFTRSNQSAPGVTKADKKGKIWLKIYEARRGEFDWEKIRELPFNSDNYSCMHPSLTPDGTKIFFSSNMPGGYGGRDLYMSEKLGDSWSKPINLGPEINTEKDEVFPFFHENGILFFASDGHEGFGGLDIFIVDLSTREWGAVTNLGKPFNSPQDDFGIIVESSGKRGYFSSNRTEGAGKDDIYHFQAPDGLQGMNMKQTIGALIVVRDSSAGRPLPDATIRIFEQSAKSTNSKEDFYKVQLAPSPDDPNDLVFQLVPKKEEEMNVPRQVTNRIGEAILQLEENRDYLILVSKPGYIPREVKYSAIAGGIPRPIEVALQLNQCIGLNGTAFSTNGRKPIANARIRISNDCTGQETTVLTNAEGKFEYCLDLGCNFTIVSEKKGYTKGNADISTVKIRGSRSAEVELLMTPTSVEALEEPLRQGSVIVLNIYYDFNQSAIRAGDDLELEALAALMKKHPTMEIELISHTDSRGDAAYNLALSLRRAETAKEFIVSKGVEPRRIKAFGYGESQLRNHCKDGVECSEEEHQRNRRTEVIVTRFDEQAGLEMMEKGNKRGG